MLQSRKAPTNSSSVPAASRHLIGWRFRIPSFHSSGWSQSLKKRSSAFGRSFTRRVIIACKYGGGALPRLRATPSMRKVETSRPMSSSQFTSRVWKWSSDAIHSKLRSDWVGKSSAKSASATAFARLFQASNSCRSFTTSVGHSYRASSCSIPSERGRRDSITSRFGCA